MGSIGWGWQCTVCAAFVGPPKGNGGGVISRLAGLVVQDETQIVGGGVLCVCVRACVAVGGSPRQKPHVLACGGGYQLFPVYIVAG